MASRGFVSSVLRTTFSTFASLIVRGAPGRGSSSSPSARLATKRARHLPTICFVTPTSAATCVFVFPPAHRKMIRARNANAWAVFGRRDQRSSSSRSASVTTSSAFGRPRAAAIDHLAIAADAVNLYLFS